MLGRAAILLCFTACTSGYFIAKITHLQLEVKAGDSSPAELVSVLGGLQNPVEQHDHNTVTQRPTEEPETINGYRHLRGHNYYKLVKAPGMTWESARRRCKEDGGDLAVINSQEEADFLYGLFSMDPSRWDKDVYEGFVGATDLITEGTFITVDGGLLSDSGFNRWLPHEPNNGDNVRSHEENCVSFHKKRGYNDIDCDRSMPYFCEVEGQNLRRESNENNSRRESNEYNSRREFYESYY